jgi:hypothetical protein
MLRVQGRIAEFEGSSHGIAAENASVAEREILLSARMKLLFMRSRSATSAAMAEAAESARQAHISRRRRTVQRVGYGLSPRSSSRDHRIGIGSS